VNIQWAIVT